MKRLSSTRLRLAPSPPILISSSAVTSRLLCWLATRLGRWWLATRLGRGWLLATRLGPELGRGPQHRLHDVLVAGAAAEVAGQRPAHVLLGRIGIGGEEGFCGQHHA